MDFAVSEQNNNTIDRVEIINDETTDRDSDGKYQMASIRTEVN